MKVRPALGFAGFVVLASIAAITLAAYDNAQVQVAIVDLIALCGH